MSLSSANSTCAVPWLATSRTTTGRALTCRSTRMRPTAGQLSSRNSAGLSRFAKSVASTIATSDGRPDAAQPVHHAGDSRVRPLAAHLGPLSFAGGLGVAAPSGWPCHLRLAIESPRACLALSRGHGPSSTEWDEILAKDKGKLVENQDRVPGARAGQESGDQDVSIDTNGEGISLLGSDH